MKQKLTIIYIFSITIVLFFVVLAFFNQEEVNEEIEEEITFESPQNIMLYSNKNDQINNINLNNYLLCVVASEMPFKYEIEALKCQAIISRTYLFNKIINHLEPVGDACEDYNHCQAYNTMEKLYEIWKNKGFSEEEISEGIEKIKKAIVETDGLVLTYDGKIIDAVFHASSPEKTEDAKAIWTEQDVPYLRSVENLEDEEYENRESITELTFEEFKERINNLNLSLDEFKSIKINSFTDSGRVYDVQIGKEFVKATKLREILGLKSTNFKIDIDNSNITFKVLGFGHGVGLSQVGADTYAKNGMTHIDILKHYYTGISVENVDNIQKN